VWRAEEDLRGRGGVGEHLQAVRQRDRRQGLQSAHRRRGVHGLRRTVGVREDDHPAHDRRPRGDLGRHAEDRRTRRQRRPAEGSRHRDGVPELRALSAHERAPEHVVRPAAAQDPEARDRAARRRSGAAAPDRSPARPPAARALGRPASARGARARDRARAEGLPDGRAALEPRRQAARRDARLDQQAAPPPRRHHGLRHPRPGRGHDDGHAHRRDEGRPDPAGREPDRALREAGEQASWPASWVRPR
jgi:hypothetical protein